MRKYYELTVAQMKEELERRGKKLSSSYSYGRAELIWMLRIDDKVSLIGNEAQKKREHRCVYRIIGNKVLLRTYEELSEKQLKEVVRMNTGMTLVDGEFKKEELIDILRKCDRKRDDVTTMYEVREHESKCVCGFLGQIR